MEEDVSCGGGEAEVVVGSEGMKREFGDGEAVADWDRKSTVMWGDNREAAAAVEDSLTEV